MQLHISITAGVNSFEMPYSKATFSHIQGLILLFFKDLFVKSPFYTTCSGRYGPKVQRQNGGVFQPLSQP